MKFTTPDMALEPYRALWAPRTTSTRSNRSTGRKPMSNWPEEGLFTGNPSTWTRVYALRPPRILMFSRSPATPLRWTSTPGSPCRTSPATTGRRILDSSRVTTLTSDACSETFSAIRVAVTTTGSVRNGSSAWDASPAPRAHATARQIALHVAGDTLPLLVGDDTAPPEIYTLP